MFLTERMESEYDNHVGVESKRLSAERPCSKDLIEINKEIERESQ